MTKALAKAAPPEVSIVFDPTAVPLTLAEGVALLNDLQDATIDNDEELAQFAEILRDAVRQKDAAAALRDLLLKPAKDHTKTVDGLFKPTLQTWAACEAELKQLIGGYQLAKEADRKRLLAEAAQAAQARKPDELKTALNAAHAAAPTKVDGVSARAVWRAVIINADLVPCDWRVPDEKRISKHARDTSPDQEPTPIAGVRFELDAQVSARR
jgi:hypothetical protein